MKPGPDKTYTNGALLAIGAFALFLVLSPASAQTEDTPAENTDQETTPMPWYDKGHDVVTDKLQETAVWFDNFFGDPRAAIDTEASAYLQVILDGFYSGVPDESDYKVRVRGGADLPRFKNKVRLVITSDADASVTGRDLAGTPQDGSRDEGDAGVGLRYLFRDRPRHKFSLGVGASGGLSPSMLLAGRYRYTRPWTANTVSHVLPTIYWKSDRGFGISTLLDYEWSPDDDTLWRYTLFGNYAENTDGLEWSTQGKWSRRLDAKTAIGVRGGVKGETEPRQILNEGWLRFRYRRNFLRPWLFYEVEPGLSWHERVDYRTEPTLALRLEVHFYKD